MNFSLIVLVHWIVFISVVSGEVAVSCAPSYDGLQRWSNVFQSESNVQITNGMSILLDVSSVSVNAIDVQSGGRLVFDWQKNINITAQHISVNGEVVIGTESCAFQNQVTITLRGSTEAVVDGLNVGTKVFAVGSGGTLDIHGAKGLGSSWTKLSATAAAGATELSLVAEVASSSSSDRSKWQVGDSIFVATTDYNPLQTERVTITEVLAPNRIRVQPPLRWSHYGEITFTVDQRAEVALVSRNIIIQGDEDGTPLGQGFGAHFIALYGIKGVRVEGVHLFRVGQNQIARYPLHFHLVGKAPPNCYFKFNSIVDSHFRCITIHGTSGVIVQGNVAYNNFGHCYYLEDGTEQSNSFVQNVGLLSHPKTAGDRIGTDAIESLSTFWITNPNNSYVGNVAVGAGTGYWVLVRNGPSGLSSQIARYNGINPSVLPLSEFHQNVAHSSQSGFQIDVVALDGNSQPAIIGAPVVGYNPRLPDGGVAQTVVTEFTAYKIRDRGIWMRLPSVIIRNSKFANNFESVQLATNGVQPPFSSMQYVEGCTFLGWSGNKGNNEENQYQVWGGDQMGSYSARDGAQPMVGIKLYDGATIVRNSNFHNFQGERNVGPHGALGARYVNEFQMATTTEVTTCSFDAEDNRVVLLDTSADGGRTYNFKDTDGSVSGHRGATIVPDTGYFKTAACTGATNMKGTIACPHKYVQLWLYDMDQKSDAANLATLTRNNHQGTDHAQYELSLTGVLGTASYKVWQPIVSVGASYLVRFQSQVTRNLALQLANAELNDIVDMAICYPDGTSIQSVKRGFADTFATTAPIVPDQGHALVTSMASARSASSLDGTNYYWDSSKRILFVRIKQRNARTDNGNFCPSSGCDWVWIQTSGAGAGRDCTADAYSGSRSIQQTSGTWLSAGFS